MVLWIIGLSGSGKTTLGREIYSRLRKGVLNVVFLDGDNLREVFGNDLGHTVEDRWQNAWRISHLCQLLNQQEIHVVCAILSIFPESQQWNREHLEDYFEVYIEVSMNHLKIRDSKGLYRAAALGQLKDVVGVDIAFLPPAQPDVVVQNEGTLQEFLTQAEHIVGLLPELTATCHP